MKVKITLEKILEIDVDSLEDIDTELPSDMEDVDLLIDEARIVTTSLVSSEVIE